MRTQRYKLYADGSFYDVEKDFKEKSPIDIKSLSGDLKALHGKLDSELKIRVAQTSEGSC